MFVPLQIWTSPTTMMSTRARSFPTVKTSWILVAQRTLEQFTQVRNTNAQTETLVSTDKDSRRSTTWAHAGMRDLCVCVCERVRMGVGGKKILSNCSCFVLRLTHFTERFKRRLAEQVFDTPTGQQHFCVHTHPPPTHRCTWETGKCYVVSSAAP